MSEILNVSKEVVHSKIERAHRSKEIKKNKHNHEIPIKEKFTDWDFSERIKSEFIKSTKNGNSQIYNTQMFSAALTSR